MNKQITCLILTAALAGAAQVASAVNYKGTDLLLVFRKDGFNDYIYNIGSVSNLTSLTTGSTTNIVYDNSAVTANFGGSLSGVRFLITGATELGNALPRVWQTDFNVVSPVPTDRTLSAFSAIRGKIDNVGVQATISTVSNAQPYIVAASDPTAYSYIVSDGTGNGGAGISTLNGSSRFPVDAIVPTSQSFYEIKINSATPPARLVGAFTLDGTGALTYTAGQVPALYASTLTAITKSGTTTSISFTSTNGNNYKVQYTAGFPAVWSQVGSLVTGDNTVKSINHNNGGSDTGYYRVQTVY